MIELPGGTFRMGSLEFYPEEAPQREVAVAPFAIDATAVTNAEFAAFVAATGYVTVAERVPDPVDYPGADPALLVPGSVVFTGTAGPVDLRDWTQWWQWRPGANWRKPFGEGSDITGKDDHPVVHVSFDDATAFANWADKRLPTEAEWEFAARGGLDGARFSWGNEPQHPSALKANTWQGRFPYLNTGANGWVGTAPVGSFPPNGFGLFEMTGNTWEWTIDYFTPNHSAADAAHAGCSCGDHDATHGHGSGTGHGSGGCSCGPGRSRSERAAASIAPGATIPRRTIKGGSHLCAPEYCLRYRPSARSGQEEDSATTHIGFRCVRDLHAP